MANPFITQNGTVYARRPDSSFTPGDGRKAITEDMVTSALVVTFPTTAPFEAILDEQGTYWRLRDRDVVYGADNVKVSLYSICEIRNMIATQATVTVNVVSNGTQGTMTFSRYRESDPIRGLAWRNGNAAIYTKTPFVSAGTPCYTDPNLTINGGTIAAVGNPVTSNTYDPTSWKGVFSEVPAALTFTSVGGGTYGTENR